MQIIGFEYPILTISIYFFFKIFVYCKKYYESFIKDKPELVLTKLLKIKYENKYLDKIHNMPNEYVFTVEEEEQFKDLLSYMDTSKAKENIINRRLDNLNNNFIMEYTPVGNVIMTYNKKKEVFDYYSDNNIPYKYLETILRKYVILYNCRPLYIDMEEELKEYDEKMKKKEQEMQKEIKEPKSVFAKFKNYNKEGSSGHVNMNAPPKNSIQPKIGKSNGEKISLKEKSNRYSCQGKISNFSMLKKIDKKTISKKNALTFSEYKNDIVKNIK